MFFDFMSLVYARGHFTRRNIDLSSLQLIGRGSERSVYADPEHPERIYKISDMKHSQQSRREVAYFRFLQSRKVPFEHLPEFYGAFECPGQNCMGLIQQRICTDSEGTVYGLQDMLRQKEAYPVTQDSLQQAYARLKAWLLRYNVLPSDMYEHNFMLKVKADGSCTLYLIDGLGSHLFIPVDNFIRSLGRKRILQHCIKFRESVRRESGGRMVLTETED